MRAESPGLKHQILKIIEMVVKEISGHSPALPLASCVTMDKLLHLPETQLSHVKNGIKHNMYVLRGQDKT